MIYFTNEIILPKQPIFELVCNLLNFVLNRQPTYGEVATYIARRLRENCWVGIYPYGADLIEPVLCLDILDHHFGELYKWNKHWFNLKSTFDKEYEILVDDQGIYLIMPESEHEARQFYFTAVPKHYYHRHPFIRALCG